MNISKKTREVLEKHPEAAYDELLLLSLVWGKQGFKLDKYTRCLFEKNKLALPSTILRAKSRIVSEKKRGESS